ncbi:GyrI-like domain-containing protein [Enterococcus alcedinis]|uniref:GyrI-like small molecule binding domain-containing protein n=1 Tax=Enterococcus alcedinis TaxID=1274384 RepID=A0A917JFI5_9ENTE|nr:GyrI-like domain-containing protein [Enterococcus alcedinis]MBP2101466.1 arabinogalactan oligomer/maltooligosaccharide transport system substrate-binding protein [Enterococcus alcedinis]GGI65142.1 hypothetical protein GCM10011482_07960 [Enterococcus alcedinis]
MKYEWRKKEKELYLPKQQPVQIAIPPQKFLTLVGAGNPNSEAFSEVVGALYSVAYGIRMAPKKGIVPNGYYEYTVYPLEGIWSLNEQGIQQYQANGQFDKEHLTFKLMIRQPDFVRADFVQETIERVAKSKPNPHLAVIEFETIEEGLVVQALHLGSYDTEAETFQKMTDFCEANDLERLSPTHKEIYLSDPRKVAPEKNKTVLRIAVRPK